jgi:type I restriction enzyme M protein
MSDTSNRVVQKLWSYCHVLRDDGLSYQDYLEQLTQLLFLKMADERAATTGQEQPIPRGYLPEPNVLAQEIADDLQAALAQIQDILGDLQARVAR